MYGFAKMIFAQKRTAPQTFRMDDEKLARYDTVTHHDRILSLILASSRHTSGGGHRARKIFISRGLAAFETIEVLEVPSNQK